MPIHLSACQGSRERADHLHRPRAQHLRRPRPEVHQGPHQGQGLRQPLGHGDRPQHRVQRLAGRILRRRKRNVEVLARSFTGWPDVQTKIYQSHFKKPLLRPLPLILDHLVINFKFESKSASNRIKIVDKVFDVKAFYFLDFFHLNLIELDSRNPCQVNWGINGLVN